MPNWFELDRADIGYKIKKGDYIVMTTAFGMQKAFKVFKTTTTKAVVSTRQGRNNMAFPRTYSIPFKPLERKHTKYKSPNVWHVNVNTDLKKMRLRFD